MNPVEKQQHATDLTKLRGDIHYYAEQASKLRNTKEINLAETHLFTARMWVGQTLRELDESFNAYPESKNPASDVIEPLASVETKLTGSALTGEFVPDLKQLRAGLDGALEQLNESRRYLIPGTPLHENLGHARQHLLEGQMWLGMALGRVRDERDAKDKGKEKEELKSESKPESKPEAKVEAKPEPKPETAKKSK